MTQKGTPLLLKRIDQFFAKIAIGCIQGYQKTLSPDKGIFSFWLKGKICSHEPHCSEYGIKTLKRYGFWNGIGKISDRVLHCLPSMQKIYDPEHYKVIFISSAPIGIPFLEQLHSDKRFEILGIITQPDKPSGRGLKISQNIIKEKALQMGINHKDIQTPQKINPEKSIEGKNLYDRLLTKKPDFLVVIAYGKIIPQNILDIPTFGSINVHGSLLPKYRGASPIQTIFLNQDKESGITIMHMDAGMDTGDIIAQKKFPIPFEWTTQDCIKYMEKIGPNFLNQSLRNYAKNHLKRQQQDTRKANLCQKIQKTDGEIQITKTTLETSYAKYRAFYLWPKIFFMLQEKKITIEFLKLDPIKYQTYKNSPLLSEKGILNPAILEIKLKPEGKKAMDRDSFKNGYLQKT